MQQLIRGFSLNGNSEVCDHYRRVQCMITFIQSDNMGRVFYVFLLPINLTQRSFSVYCERLKCASPASAAGALAQFLSRVVDDRVFQYIYRLFAKGFQLLRHSSLQLSCGLFIIALMQHHFQKQSLNMFKSNAQIICSQNIYSCQYNQPYLILTSLFR
ncbi:hypothetical protein FGO68_gene2728 [Halteria grandinella]|uniref:Uncharacterized protein n=1 Tax=Halteria grandinella TaxID=5974 RepID=A0A8J8P3B3_HALGN|nr:hypothetical protein FGO68_gene2728 [Halteria grandinella]